MNLYQTAASILIKMQSSSTIVIVGANDGKGADPIFEVANATPVKTKMILIEPNPFLIPFLAENYKAHPKTSIVQGAIGDREEIILYAIKPDYFHLFKPKYAKDWPIYRAPTGVTSSNYNHVQKWATNNCSDSSMSMSEIIESITVPCLQLRDILEKLNVQSKIDVLQVDAEGFDDQVIYSSNIEFSKPLLIYFELTNMTAEANKRLLAFLTKNRYLAFEMGHDALAIKREPTLTSLILRAFIEIIRFKRQLETNFSNGQKRRNLARKLT